MNKIYAFILVFLLFTASALAVVYIPSGDYDYKNRYSIFNMSNLTANRVCISGVCYITWPTGGNTSWNQSLADTLYSPIGEPIASSLGNWSLDKASYLTATQSNNKFLVNMTCAGAYVLQNATTSGAECVLQSQGNMTFNQSLTNTLYYAASNPLGFYNSTTLPVYPVADNTSWNESRARSLFVNASYVSGAVGQNLTYALITTANGNWSLDKASYATLTQLNAGANLTYALINTNMGNWSKDKSTLPNLTYAQIATNMGNWSADKSGYATLTQLNAGANLTLAAINTNMGNASKHVGNCGVNTVVQNITSTGIQCVADSTGSSGNTSFNQSLTDTLYYPRNTNPSGFYNITTLPASGGDNTSWNESRANALYTTPSYVAGAVGQNLTYALITTANGNWSRDKLGQNNGTSNLTLAQVVTNIGNWSLDKSSYATLTQLNAGANLTLAQIATNMGNASKHVATCSAGTVIQNITATGIQCVTDQTGGAGGNPFNQSLNTSDNVIFNTLNTTGNITIFGGAILFGENGSLRANDPVYPPFVNRTVSDQTVTGTTLQNITGLTWTALANTNYTLQCVIFFISNTTTNGLSLTLEDWGTAVQQFRASVMINAVSTTTSNGGTFNTTATKITSTAVAAVNTVYSANLNANIIGAAAANSVITPQFSAEVAGQNTTIVRDSYCQVTRA